ncbi:MAG: UDP-N-acetylmuramate dehydrogenase, partial [Planctomycetota bacterium]|nr:UDP-N-acetylmuramate dehydrogenase [Planctomycetota bacterium]
MSSLDDFREITQRDVPLAPFTWFRVGGPAQYLIQPRHQDELIAVVRMCHEQGIPLRILGGGSNLLIREQGVTGVVIRLVNEAFSQIDVTGNTVRAQAGALLSQLISRTVKASLAGLETLVGIPGTLGGALHGNAGGRSGDISQFVSEVSLMTFKGETLKHSRDEMTFAYRSSSLDSSIILDAEFQLQPEDPDEITRRMRKLWIMKKATQPLSFQSAGFIFKNPRGLSAGALIEQAGLKGTRIG